MVTSTSRYYLVNDDLRQACLALQIGQGIQARILTPEATNFIVRAEDWADIQISEFVGVPLKPLPAQGQSAADFSIALSQSGAGLTRRNFPLLFTNAVVYKAVAEMVYSEFSEHNPNVSEYGKLAEDRAEKMIELFKDNNAILVGAGRRRNFNPFIPPNIAPRQEKAQIGSPGGLYGA